MEALDLIEEKTICLLETAAGLLEKLEGLDPNDADSAKEHVSSYISSLRDIFAELATQKNMLADHRPFCKDSYAAEKEADIMRDRLRCVAYFLRDTSGELASHLGQAAGAHAL
jgi:hypothetical protein